MWGKSALPLFLGLALPSLYPLALAKEDQSRALLYLMKYGYVQPRNGSAALLTEDALQTYVKRAVMDFQAFAGLNQTGNLDSETKELMNTPRCGVRDIIGHGARARRRKRYVLQGSRWKVNELTYRLTKYPSTTRLSKSDVDSQVKQAFTLWEQATDLKFTRRDSGGVHIEIRFEKYEHGDGDPFDGPGGTLAHAYFPQFGGDVHVDDTEYWTINSFKGTNLLQTMTHELGHSLGLSHSDVRNAVMAPFYRGWQPNLKLEQDDTRAIQSLYGQKVFKPTPRPRPAVNPIPPVTRPGPDIEMPKEDNNPPTPSSGGPSASLCSDTNFNAILRTKSGTSYVFRGEDYWRLTSDSIADGYPRKISDDWSGIPGNLDAGFTWQDTGATYIFKGAEYWKFQNMDLQPGYPKPIKEGFPGIPNNVDTAFVWGGNGKIYFFKGSQYWKFDPERKPHVRSDRYPKNIAQWDLPNDVGGALQWDNGRTYFFRQGQYWRFNDRGFTIDRASPTFPRSTGEWWFGCPRVRQLKQGRVGEEPLLQENPEGLHESSLGGNDLGDYADVGDEDLDAESA